MRVTRLWVQFLSRQNVSVVMTEEAMVAPDADTWLQAMKSEMDWIHKDQTWELVELPVGRKPLPGKWVSYLLLGSSIFDSW